MKDPHQIRNMHICALYQSGMNLNEVGRDVGMSSSHIAWVLDKYGIRRRKCDLKRRHSLFVRIFKAIKKAW